MKQGERTAEKTVMTRMEKRAMKRASKGCGRETIGRMIEKKRKPEEVGEKREAETIARAKDRERYFRQLPFENDSIWLSIQWHQVIDQTKLLSLLDNCKRKWLDSICLAVIWCVRWINSIEAAQSFSYYNLIHCVTTTLMCVRHVYV